MTRRRRGNPITKNLARVMSKSGSQTRKQLINLTTSMGRRHPVKAPAPSSAEWFELPEKADRRP